MAEKPPFDQIGKRYDDSFVERDAQVAEGAWLISQLAPPARVLDLGCGSGLPTARQLLNAGIEVVGIDESAVMLGLAQEQAPGGRYLHRDLRDVADLGDFDMFPLVFMGEPVDVTAYPPDELTGLVERAGFEVLSLHEVEVEAERNRLEVALYVRAKGN